MRTYRELFRTPEFTPLFATAAAQIAATTVSGLALGTLVYAATGSPLLSALSMFGSSFAQVVGAATLLSAADRLPPRAATAGLALAFGLCTAVLAIPGLPLWLLFAVVFAQGLIASVGIGAKDRIKGLRLTATDADWSTGEGPEVSGPVLSLAMAMTGRSAALAELTGEGVEVLRSRMP